MVASLKKFVEHRPSIFRPLARGPERLGDILVKSGVLTRSTVRHALEQRYVSRAQLGEVLRSRRLISNQELTRSMARQWSLGVIDLKTCPPERDLLLRIDAAACIQARCVPWRKVEGRVILAVADPANADQAIAASGLSGQSVAIALSEPAGIRNFLETYFGHEIEEDARLASPPDMNCREWRQGRAAIAIGGFFGILIVLAITEPVAAFWCAFAIALISNLATSLVRAAALIARFWPEKRPKGTGQNIVRLDNWRALPVISILVPLHKEDRVIPSLVRNINRLDYPPELLDIKLVIEADDKKTSDAIEKVDLPGHFDVVRVPKNGLQTKPRAMNYALNFCRGTLVGIFDAEDRPDPDQLRKVIEHLHHAPPDVACVQGRLDFYNPKHNWLSRCFTIEYAVWFSLLIRGTRRLGLPIPLGGTTVYFRRKHLEDVSGWDAHNVTEDADLGIRLFRFGYRAEYLPSTTWEEANSRPISWVRQRSRWLKGFMMTWAVHARRPKSLYGDLGIISGSYVHILLLGGIVSYLSIPVFWAVLAGMFGLDLKTHLGGADWLWNAAFVSMLAGQGVMLTAAFLAASEPGKRHLIPWVPTLIFYWPLGALAGFKALIEMVFAPHYWDKTEHGAYSDPDTESHTSPSEPMETPKRVASSMG